MMERAETMETSCSVLVPPKMTATFVFGMGIYYSESINQDSSSGFGEIDEDDVGNGFGGDGGVVDAVFVLMVIAKDSDFLADVAVFNVFSFDDGEVHAYPTADGAISGADFDAAAV